MNAIGDESTQQRIQRVATTLFADNGYHNTGVTELGLAVGLGRGALYHHIGSKEKLLFTIIDGVVPELLEAGRAEVRSTRNPEDKLRLLASQLLHSIVENRQVWRVTLRETETLSGEPRRSIDRHWSDYEGLWGEVFAEGANSARWRPVTGVQLKGIVGMFLHSYVWLHADGPLPIDTIADRLVDVVLVGVRNRPGRGGRRRA